MINVLNLFKKTKFEIEWQDRESEEKMTSVYDGRPIFTIPSAMQDIVLYGINEIDYVDAKLV